MTPEQIRLLRRKKGMTQERLATLLRVDVSTIFRWETGAVTPSLLKMAILKDVLLKPGDGQTHPIVNVLLDREVGTAILDFQGVYLEHNDAYEELSGVARVRLLGSCAWEVFDQLTRLLEIQSNVNLERIVQGKIASIRVENLINPASGKSLNHDIHVLSQNYFTTIVIHEIVPSSSNEDCETIDLKYNY